MTKPKIAPSNILMLLGWILFLGLTACSTNQSKNSSQAEKYTPVKEQKLSTDFSSEGIKLFYTSSGALEAIEVVGHAPAWKKSVGVLAEADAMEKLNSFINGKSVSSERRTRIITKALDIASDTYRDKKQSADGIIEFNSAEVENELKSSADSINTSNSTTLQKAQVVESTLTSTVSTIKSEGFLIGVRKISEAVKDNGKIYVATYRWSHKDLDAAADVRESMRKAQQR